jgi:hypothetical protein
VTERAEDYGINLTAWEQDFRGTQGHGASLLRGSGELPLVSGRPRDL